MKKKRKLKKWVYYLIILLVLIPILFIVKEISFKSNKKVDENKDNSEVKEDSREITYTDIIKDILKYENNDYDEKFLNYIYESYGIDSLNKLLDILKDNKYDRNIWHDITNNSYIVLKDKYNKVYDNNDSVTVVDGNKENVSISFAGDISLADNWEIMPYYKSRGKKIYG